ncbi:MAG TPA: carboxypeptidase regulatory-like domain-containing protein [Terriglobia bacterium]|nr:carboxypeptidase regulatory-like domain-containing protein [Terriglobia bacterium]
MTKKVFAASVVALVVVLGLAVARVSLEAQQTPAAASALTGTVRSTAEGPMEGVLVSAKRNGSTITTTVVTNAQGVYSFPRARLEPGQYSVTVRAVGYALEGASSKAPAAVTAGNATELNLNLRESNPLELALQLTDPEWLSSFPLSEQAKFELRDCSRCHTLQRVAMSTYNKDQLAWVMKRMVYSSGSSTMTFQLPPDQTATWGRPEWGEPTAAHKRQAEAVAAINLSEGMWKYELKKLPRPKGKETQVVYTTYDLPVTHRPHDTRMGLDGAIWYNHFNDNAIARLDIKTGQTKEWRWPYRAAEGSFAPTGARTLMGPDAKGRFYIGNQAQDGLVVFDPSTEKFTYSNVAGGGEMMDVSNSSVDNHGWRSGPDAYRVNLDTLQVTTTVKGSRPLARYDIASDTKNNLYGAGRTSTYVWYADAKTGQVAYYDIPATPRGVGGLGGGMRRGKADKQDRLWWGGYDGNFVGMLDPRKPAGQQMRLWAMPPYFFPYDAHYDEQGYTWTGGIYSDRVARLNVETGEWVYYLLPQTANIRDIDLKPAQAGGLSGLWFGHTHQGMITLVEPLSK